MLRSAAMRARKSSARQRSSRPKLCGQQRRGWRLWSPIVTVHAGSALRWPMTGSTGFYGASCRG
jgi:hypothetical protein